MSIINLICFGASLQLIIASTSYGFVSTVGYKQKSRAFDSSTARFANKKNVEGKTPEQSSDRRAFVSTLVTSAATLTAFGPTDSAFADLETTRDIFRSPEQIEARKAAEAKKVAVASKPVPGSPPEKNAKRKTSKAERLGKPTGKIVDGVKPPVPKKEKKLTAKEKKAQEELLAKQAKEAEEERIQKEEEEARLLEEKRLVEAAPDKPRILLLGGTSNVGKEVRKTLKELDIFVIATSRDGRDDTIALDVLKIKSGLKETVKSIANENKITGVISCIGAIGTSSDSTINGASGTVAIGAKEANFVKNFVFISISPRVREDSAKKPELKDYFEGKAFSEQVISGQFGGEGLSYTLIEPGSISGAKPEVPGAGDTVPVKAVANAAVVGALGLSSAKVFDTKKKIEETAKKTTVLQQSLSNII